MPPTVRVEGARQLRSALKRAAGDLEDMKDASERAGIIVATQAANDAPRRTGRLAFGVKAGRAAGRATVSVPGVVYAAPIHWGWPARHIAAQPFILDAAHDTQPRWLPVYAADIDRIVDRVHAAT